MTTAAERWHAYRQATAPLPATMLAWPFYGAGLESLGVDGRPVTEPVPACGPDHLLVRVDALGLCASDAKMVRMGQDYPLFFPRDFQADPARLGHEAAMTVVQAGARWQDSYYPGQRLGVQANVYAGGQRAIFGVNIPGAMAQYVLLDERVLAGDAGSYVFPVPDALTYVDIALLEPWACVDVAYTPVRRLELKPGGHLWLRGRPGDDTPYHLDAPLPSATVVLADVPPSLAAWVREQPVTIVEDTGAAFDDIILLDPRSAAVVAAAADRLAIHGTLTLVTPTPLDGPVPVDVGRLHYDHLAYLGCPGPDIAAAYGPARNRSDLRPGGVALIVGAGGTLGRMHTQRALQMADGPRAVIVTNRGLPRLHSLVHDFGPLAAAAGRELVAVSPTAEPGRLAAEVQRLTRGRGCDDVVVVVPDAATMEESAAYLAPDGMLVVFAGVPAGTRANLPLHHVALRAAQFTGTSGSTVPDELRVLDKIVAGVLSPSRSLAAIGGMHAMAAGLQAVMEHAFPGKVVIFPQLLGLPLLPLDGLPQVLPGAHALLGPDGAWSAAAEVALFQRWL